jgi:hypothetical protein
VDWQGEIERLSDFLNERFGEMREDDEATADFAMRLLEPQHRYAPDGRGRCLECGMRRRAHG